MRYLFYLESYAFLWSSKKQILVYNSLSGHKAVFQNNSILANLINKISPDKLAYSVELSSADLKDKQILHFIKKTRSIFAGDIIKLEESKVKPAIIVPYLNFQKDKGMLNLGDSKYLGFRIIENIYEINICTCEESSKSPLLRKSLSTKDYVSKNNEVPIEEIINFISKIPPAINTNINIFLFDEEKICYSLSLLKRLPKGFQTQIVVLSSIYPSFHRSLESNFTVPHFVSIQLSLNENRDFIEEIASFYDSTNNKLKWILPFSTINEYELAREMIEIYNFENFDLLPVFNGNNTALFEELVFIDYSDIDDIKLNKRQIYANQTINTNDFGRLTITYDGNIYANVYHSPLGTINDNIRELVYKEMDQGISWRRIRDMEPCCNCVYQWLCPSPSNYELAIGKPNLCHVVG